MTQQRIEFVRLVEVPLTSVLALLNEPRNARHMPLAQEFTPASAAAWVEAKDAQWSTHGYGPWAVLVDGTFAGWGGFQREADGADFALVLDPGHWGQGAAITRAALDRGFDELGLDAVLVALPYTRNPERVVRRFGFTPAGEVTHGGAAFRQYRLTRDAWRRTRPPGRTSRDSGGLRGEAVLPRPTPQEVAAAYDARSQEYIERFGRLAQLAELDRALVRRWRAGTTGPLLDAGCGPGQWVEVLQDGGRGVLGVDLSERFLASARRQHPAVPLLRASLSALPLRPASVGGVLAWYSIIHTPPDELPGLLAELGRVLRPDGSLLVGFVDGEPGRSFPHAVVTAYFWSVEALGALLREVGLEVVEHHRRHDDGSRPSAALVARPAR